MQTTAHIREPFNDGASGGGFSSAPRVADPFSIGPVRAPNRLVQAPMAGISGRAFRLQARRFGAGLLTTEMVSSYGVQYHNPRTRAMLELTGDEHPVAVQLFGSRPGVMARAAAGAEQAGADIIDINMGCPVKKVVKTGAGVALMADEELAARLVAAVVEAVKAPVTVKIRSGPGKWVTALEFARRLVAAGAAAVCIHPRLAVQGQKGKADHAVSAKLAAALSVPVIASGDIFHPDKASRLLGQGCAAVMVGRAALGNPWIFEDMLSGAEPQRRPLDEVLAEMGRFYLDLAAETGEERANRQMRKFYGWYLRPFRPDAAFRDGLRRAGGHDAAARLIRDHLKT